jgi:hypothetical protein
VKLAYSDFMIPVFHYFALLNRHEFVYEWVVPALLTAGACLVANFWGFCIDAGFLKQFVGALINLFAILVGFTITSVAIFVTIDRAKNDFLSKTSSRCIFGDPITWYHFIYLNLIYAIVVGVILLGLSLGSLLLLTRVTDGLSVAIFSVLTFGTAHLLLLSMRNVTNLYFAFFEGAK